jgi:predicted ATPase
VPLSGLSPAEVDELVAALAGEPIAARWGAVIAARSQGHPFFARELTSVMAAGGDIAGVPAAIREVVARRLSRLSTDCVRLLEACSVGGPNAQPDVLADVMGWESGQVAELLRETVARGVLTSSADIDVAGIPAQGVRFGHDLYRESIYVSLARTQRVDLHRRVGEALVRRYGRGATVFPAELARHFAASAAVTGAEPALGWARRAAAADEARFAYADAADHLARARRAVDDAGLSLSNADLIDLLTVEAMRDCGPAMLRLHTVYSTRPGSWLLQAAIRSEWLRSRLGWTGSAPASPCRAGIWSRCWNGRERQ